MLAGRSKAAGAVLSGNTQEVICMKVKIVSQSDRGRITDRRGFKRFLLGRASEAVANERALLGCSRPLAAAPDLPYGRLGTMFIS